MPDSSTTLDPRYAAALADGVAEAIERFLDANPDRPAPLFDDQALSILSQRYFVRDASGEVVEDARLLLARVAVAVAGLHRCAEDEADERMERARLYHDAMARLEFLPNSPALMNAGTRMPQLAACFFIPVEDSIVSIMDAVKDASRIFQSGGGVGIDFSALRPKDALISTTGGKSSGPVSFMRMFDTMADVVKQGGRRRGALMGLLSVHHPDIREFIACKDDDVSLQNFNISVMATDEFMQAVRAGSLYDIRDPRTGETVRHEDAREIWTLIVEHAWRTGDPGVLFIDEVNRENPFDIDRFPEHRMHGCNPCGEQVLEDYEACCLGSINLARMVCDGKVDYERIEQVAAVGVMFLDDVIDASEFPIEAIDAKVRRNRKVGLGVMGWADMLIELGIPYGSSESLDIADAVMSAVQQSAHAASRHLGRTRGICPSSRELRVDDGRRNATVTTIAPTGTISMLANGVSSGIEPVFAFAYTKKVMDGTLFRYVHPAVRRLLDQGVVSDRDVDHLIEHGRWPDGLAIPAWLVGAMDIAPEQHVRMQAAFQEHVDNAISKTVNLPNSATASDVARIYQLAYALGCKGITIYRDGSKSDQVLFAGSAASNAEPKAASDDAPRVRKRPEALFGITVRTETPCGKLYVTISEDEDGRPFEVFCRLGKSGACAGAVQETMGRLISQSLREGGDMERIVKQLKGVSCGQRIGFGEKATTSCIDAIGSVLKRYLRGEFHDQIIGDDDEDDPAPLDQPLDLAPRDDGHAEVRRNGACPECGSALEHEGGCAVCRACGYSKCA